TYKNRAALYLEQKNYDLAWADVRKCQQLGGTVSPDFIRSLEKASSRSAVSPDAAPASRPAVSEEQREMMRKTGAKNPEALEAFTRARETRDLEEQIKLFTKAVDLDPEFGRAYNCRGDAYALKGDYDQAIKDYTKAIELMPTLAVAYNNRGVSNIKKFEHVRAIQDFDKAIELDPGLAGAYYNRGDAYGYIGDYDRALRDFTKAIELKPDDPDAYQGRAMAHYQKRNYDEAWADVMMCKRFGGQVQQEFLQALSAATKRPAADTTPALPSKKEEDVKKQATATSAAPKAK
ncbi:MAG: tetratricopeptide repeat protein, partial [Verrucomicrobiae bacterium]|nr:tetratricopeptide repeat protein [Verrucomicrobiae bacterium]